MNSAEHNCFDSSENIRKYPKMQLSNHDLFIYLFIFF